jgi:hypothetical protein
MNLATVGRRSTTPFEGKWTFPNNCPTKSWYRISSGFLIPGLAAHRIEPHYPSQVDRTIPGQVVDRFGCLSALAFRIFRQYVRTRPMATNGP